MNITKETIKSTLRTIMAEESEYQTFFKKALEKAGKSIPSMSDEEKKEFFNKIDAAWNAKGEKNEGNAFGAAVVAAKEKGEDEFEVGGKTYKVEESAGCSCGCGTCSESVNEGQLKKFDDVHIKSKNLSGMVYKISGNTVVVRTIDGLVKAKKDDVTKIHNDNVNEAMVKIEVDMFKQFNQRRPDKTMPMKIDSKTPLSKLLNHTTFKAMKQKYDYIELHYGDKFLGSAMAGTDNWEFKKGRGLQDTSFKESVNEAVKKGKKYGDWTVMQYEPVKYDDYGAPFGGRIQIVNQKTGHDLLILNDLALRGSKWYISINRRSIKDTNPETVIQKAIKNSVNEATPPKGVNLSIIDKEIKRRGKKNVLKHFQNIKKNKLYDKVNTPNSIDYLINYVSNFNESINEGKHDVMLDKLASIVKGVNFMNVGKELKKNGIRYSFSTSMIPMYKIDKLPIAIVNKKYAAGAEREVGDIAIGLLESINEADVVGKTIFSDGKGKLFFGYYKTDDAVEFVDYKTWKKLNFKDVSKGDTNKDRLIKAILKKQKQFNKKVEFNMWAKQKKRTFEETIDWFIQNGWINNINKGGIKESVTDVLGEGRAFVAAAKKAKEEGKTEFEFNGKTYPVTLKEEAINERRLGKVSMLKDIESGDTSRVEGVKISPELAFELRMFLQRPMLARTRTGIAIDNAQMKDAIGMLAKVGVEKRLSSGVKKEFSDLLKKYNK